MFDFDPRDSSDARDRDADGLSLSRWDADPRDRDEPDRELDLRKRDPRDPFVDSLDLPRGLERGLVQDDRERLYELHGDDSRTLATIGAFRVISERDLDGFREAEDSLAHLRDEGLIRTVAIDGDERAEVLTDRAGTCSTPIAATASPTSAKRSTPRSAGLANCGTTPSSFEPT